ncbi:MAG: thiamine phosphate synthase [Pseudomonadota bacterium]
MSAPRLYLLTPPLSGPSTFADELAAALDAAPFACVRLRMSAADEDALRRTADQLREVCHARDVALVLTDHYRLVASLGLDGVHLADARLSVRDARKELGRDAIVGAFAGASKHDGMTAAEAGADYVSLGPVSPSPLGDGETAEPHLFQWWSEMIQTPVVAEGGVTAAYIGAMAEVADFFAVDAAVWDHADGATAGAKAAVEALGDD